MSGASTIEEEPTPDPDVEAELPAKRWPPIYAVVLGILALDIAVFAALTRFYS